PPNPMLGRIGSTSGSCAWTSPNLIPATLRPVRVDRITRPPVVPWNQRSTLGLAGVVRYSAYVCAIADRIHRIRTARDGTRSSVFVVRKTIETNDSGVVLASAVGRGGSQAPMTAPAAPASAAAAPSQRHLGDAVARRRIRRSRKEIGRPSAVAR